MTMADATDRNGSDTLDRRAFLATAAATAASIGLADAALAQGGAAPTAAPAPAGPPPFQQPQQPALGNGEMIAMNFSPYPGGTGALLERVVKERGAAAFARHVPKPTPLAASDKLPATDEEIAFLPVHRLSAFIHARKLTSARLTDIYLTRLKTLNPKLLCAVTILEDSARKEAAERDAELKAGKSRGPLHGIPYGIKDLFAVKGARTSRPASSTWTPRCMYACATRVPCSSPNSRPASLPKATSGSADGRTIRGTSPVGQADRRPGPPAPQPRAASRSASGRRRKDRSCRPPPNAA
jgi:hypothetical protein